MYNSKTNQIYDPPHTPPQNRCCPQHPNVKHLAQVRSYDQ